MLEYMLIDLLNNFFNLFGETNRTVSNTFFFFFFPNFSLPSQALLQLLLQVTDNFKELPVKLLAGPPQSFERRKYLQVRLS